jgi:hypothetical protein
MFESFWLAGFDGSTGRDRTGRWFDHVVATGHDRLAFEDYAAAAFLGFRGAREAVRWPLVDLGGGRYDFSTLDPFLTASRRSGVEVIWDLFHYGYPDGLDLMGPDFPHRFADYCGAVARHVARHTPGTCWFTPVNEPSFMAYAAGEMGMFAPWLTGRGFEMKVQLVRAAILGIEAIRGACPRARIVNVDPVCHVVPPKDRPDLEPAAAHFNTCVLQAWDMLSGRLMPDLGGSPAHLEVVGINYYWTNQWELGGPMTADGVNLPLADDDPRRVPLGTLVRRIWERYGCEVVVSETAHIGESRPHWVREVACQAGELLKAGVPLGGVCLFPIIAMPTWHDPEHWPEMALWEPSCRVSPSTGRIVYLPMLDALREVQRLGLISRAGRSVGKGLARGLS